MSDNGDPFIFGAPTNTGFDPALVDPALLGNSPWASLTDADNLPIFADSTFDNSGLSASFGGYLDYSVPIGNDFIAMAGSGNEREEENKPQMNTTYSPNYQSHGYEASYPNVLDTPQTQLEMHQEDQSEYQHSPTTNAYPEPNELEITPQSNAADPGADIDIMQGYSLSFNDHDEAISHKYGSQDTGFGGANQFAVASVPEPAYDRQYVRLLMQAFYDTSYANDNPQVIRPWQAGGTRHTHDNAILIEKICWELLERLKDQVINGTRMAKWQNIDKSKREVLTFPEVFNQLIRTLQESKSICKRLVSSDYMDTVIDDPCSAVKRVLSNKKLNQTKAKIMAKGRMQEQGKREHSEGVVGESTNFMDGNDEGSDHPPPKKTRKLSTAPKKSRAVSKTAATPKRGGRAGSVIKAEPAQVAPHPSTYPITGSIGRHDLPNIYKEAQHAQAQIRGFVDPRDIATTNNCDLPHGPFHGISDPKLIEAALGANGRFRPIAPGYRREVHPPAMSAHNFHQIPPSVPNLHALFGTAPVHPGNPITNQGGTSGQIGAGNTQAPMRPGLLFKPISADETAPTAPARQMARMAPNPHVGPATQGPRFGQAIQTPHVGQAIPTPHFGQTTQGPHVGQAFQTPHVGQATQGHHVGQAAQTPQAGQATQTPRVPQTANPIYGQQIGSTPGNNDDAQGPAHTQSTENNEDGNKQ